MRIHEKIVLINKLFALNHVSQIKNSLIYQTHGFKNSQQNYQPLSMEIICYISELHIEI